MHACHFPFPSLWRSSAVWLRPHAQGVRKDGSAGWLSPHAQEVRKGKSKVSLLGLVLRDAFAFLAHASSARPRHHEAALPMLAPFPEPGKPAVADRLGEQRESARAVE